MTLLAPRFLFYSAALLFLDVLSIVSTAGKTFMKLLHVLCFGIAFSMYNNQTARMSETLCAAAVELRRKKPFL